MTSALPIAQYFRAGRMSGIVKAGRVGDAEIIHDTPSPLTRMRAAMAGQPLGGDVYTRLLIKGRLWMTDAEFEWRTNLVPISKLKGDVMIAGLGIGFILPALLGSGDVESITVLERDADVIALVKPNFEHLKLHVINADVKTWDVPKKAFDAIYFDIWPDVPNSDNWEEMKALKKRYRPALRTGGWCDSWCSDTARRG